MSLALLFISVFFINNSVLASPGQDKECTRFALNSLIHGVTSEDKNETGATFKFAYKGKGPQRFSDAIGADGYNVSDDLAAIIKFFKEENIDFTNANLVDIGPGTGEKGAWIINAIQSQLGGNPSYYALDFSEEMLLLAKNTIDEKTKNITPFGMKIDLENEWKLRYKKNDMNKPSVFLFLGQTLGNFDDRAAVLQGIRSNMKTGDILVLGVDHFDPIKVASVVAGYDNKLMGEFLQNQSEFLNLDNSKGSIKYYFNYKTNSVEAAFRFKNGVQEPIVLFKSHRFTTDEIEQLSYKSDFSLAGTAINEGTEYKVHFLKIE
ncbi:MAG: hypothetical protein HON90_14090 [Halobacteriovoraceae bacterium]|jgi:uncharacterized SAM-dependent methyltransferase|nr:hypothetical protein [Halobacteriovoraceae bacterium]